MAMQFDTQKFLKALGERAGGNPFGTEFAMQYLKRYKSPAHKLKQLIDQGGLIRLKNGLYLLGAEWRSMQPVRGHIANRLHHPSYVSFESALSRFDLIPERVNATMSACLGRGKVYENELGRFVYKKIPKEAFAFGYTQITEGPQGRYMIASHEKAILDLIYVTRNLQRATFKVIGEFLFEDLRIDEDTLCLEIDPQKMKDLALLYGSDKVLKTATFLEKFCREHHA